MYKNLLRTAQVSSSSGHDSKRQLSTSANSVASTFDISDYCKINSDRYATKAQQCRYIGHARARTPTRNARTSEKQDDGNRRRKRCMNKVVR